MKVKILVGEGERIPPFFFPVRREMAKLGVECWVFPLNIIVWNIYVIGIMLMVLSKEMLNLLILLKKKIK